MLCPCSCTSVFFHFLYEKAISTTLKYIFNSIVATASDFLGFHLFLTVVGIDTVFATFGGNVIGAVVSFFLLRYFVFVDAAPARLTKQMSRFAIGVGLIMCANVILVTFFHHLCALPPWPSRIGAALGAWIVGYFFNRKLVFQKEPNTTSEF